MFWSLLTENSINQNIGQTYRKEYYHKYPPNFQFQVPINEDIMRLINPFPAVISQ